MESFKLPQLVSLQSAMQRLQAESRRPSTSSEQASRVCFATLRVQASKIVIRNASPSRFRSRHWNASA